MGERYELKGAFIRIKREYLRKWRPESLSGATFQVSYSRRSQLARNGPVRFGEQLWIWGVVIILKDGLGGMEFMFAALSKVSLPA